MHARRIGWIWVTSLVACLGWGIVPSSASSQGNAEIAHLKYCDGIMNARTDALVHDRWDSMISLSRQYIGNCLDLSRDSKPESEALYEIAKGLDKQDKFDEAIPVLGRCVAIKPDSALCYLELGHALQGLGRLEDARKSYERVVSIGGYDDLSAAAITSAKQRLAHFPPAEEPRPSVELRPTDRSPSHDGGKFGTGFVISDQGHILTNNHVVAGCRTLVTRDGKPLHVLSKNPSSDLALLQASVTPSTIAVFRTGPAPELGDDVVAFGFPLPGLLSSDGNVSAGVLSAVTGIQNDVRFIQISAPVQPGNSGGPLFDSSGHVMGVVVAKLDAVKIAEITGDVPQNVNFAVNLAEVRAFLDDAGVPYRKEVSQRAIATRSIAAMATQIAVAIECVP
jgi:hypothetical protein